jgi:hypothetical protein
MGCGKCPKAHKNPYAGAVDVDSAIYSIDFDLIGPGPELRIPGAAAQTRAVSGRNRYGAGICFPSTVLTGTEHDRVAAPST